MVADSDQVSRLLSSVLSDPTAVLQAADTPEIQERVQQQRRIATTYGIPSGEPCFVVDDPLVAGVDVRERLELAVLNSVLGG
jgi:2-hydroxychromene-2-carboxylate isomerase